MKRQTLYNLFVVIIFTVVVGLAGASDIAPYVIWKEHNNVYW